MTRRPWTLLATPLALGLALAPAAAPAAPAADVVRGAVRAWRQSHARAVVEDLARLVQLPNVAGNREQMERNARHLFILLRKRGFEARLLATGQSLAPVVFGELNSPGATRTLMVYAHYDGQAVDPAQWSGDPWTPVLRDGRLEAGAQERPLEALDGAGEGADEWRLYGRSASDDRGPIVSLLAAVDALRAAHLPLSVNLKVLLEGEEEAGSPHLETILRGRQDLLAADLLLLCDGPVHASGRPQLYFGARGVMGLELTVYGPARPLHSGHYGNWARNPSVELAHLLASMRDQDGRVTIEGFSKDVRPPSEAERRALAGIPDLDQALRDELLLGSSEGAPARLAERVMLPALNLRGLSSGHVGEQATNSIPTEARASIDFRLVPDQAPAGVRAAVEAHLRRQGFFVVEGEPAAEVRRAHPRVVRVEWEPGYPAARTDLDLPVAREVRRVVEEALGAPPVSLPTLGGSVPMRTLAEATRLPVIGLGLVNADNNQHAANENLRLRNLWDAIEVQAALLARLGLEPRP